MTQPSLFGELPDSAKHEWEDNRLVCRYCGLSAQELLYQPVDFTDPHGRSRCSARALTDKSSWMAAKIVYQTARPCLTNCVLAIVGSRILEDRTDANEIIEVEFDRHLPRWFVSGGAPGIDTMAEDIANRRGYQRSKTIHLPERRTWEFYQKRDRLIALDGECLVSIEGRKSRTHGARWTANEAIRVGQRVTRYVI